MGNLSFTIKEVRDQNEYIQNMGLPEIERVKKEANIATALAQRDTDILRAQALRDAAVARALADEHRIIAEAESHAKEAEATRDLDIKRAQYLELVNRQKAQADRAYDIQTAIMEQQLVAERVRIELIERCEQVKVQEAEIARSENELTARELTSAQVEAKRILALAEAAKQRLCLEAEGRAEAIRLEGEAEASIVRAKGEAEAAAMEERANAYRGYTEAAVLDRMLSLLPEMVRAVSEPLAKVDRITVVSTGDGNGDGLGVSKVIADVAKVVAQAPALLEALSGVRLADLMRSLPALRSALPKVVPPARAPDSSTTTVAVAEAAAQGFSSPIAPMPLRG